MFDEKRILEVMYQTGSKITECVAFLYIIGITILNFFFHSNVSMKKESMEKITFSRNNLSVYLVAITIVLLLFVLRNKLSNIEGNKLYICFALVYFVVGLIIVTGIGVELRADAQLINDAAVAFSKGDFSALQKGGYLFHYPHQLGVVSYERILLNISNKKEIIFFFNLLFALLNNWTCWRISKEFFGNNQYIQNITLVLSFLFLPQLFFVAFAYGTLPGLAMLLLAVYCQTLCIKKKSHRYLVLTIIFGVLANLLKNNYLIGIIALAFVFVLNALKRRKIILLYYAGLLLFAVVMSGKMTIKWYEMESGYEISEGEPKILWIAMGLRDESQKLGGWYDGYNYQMYGELDYNASRCNKVALEAIRERISSFIDDPEYAFKFFREKIESTWCDPLFQSVWSGPLPSLDQDFKNEQLSVLYQEGEINDLVKDYCGGWLLLAYVSLCVFCIMVIRRKENSVSLIGLIFFAGGFTFHVFWETKSQYVYPYIFMMIPYMACSIERLSVFADKQRERLCGK